MLQTFNKKTKRIFLSIYLFVILSSVFLLFVDNDAEVIAGLAFIHIAYWLGLFLADWIRSTDIPPENKPSKAAPSSPNSQISEARKIELLFDLITTPLISQFNLIKSGYANTPNIAKSPWSLGYIGSFTKTAIQNSPNINSESKEAFELLNYAFVAIFGNNPGHDLFKSFLIFEKMNESDIIDGIQSGTNDYFNWIQYKEPPFSWVSYTQENGL